MNDSVSNSQGSADDNAGPDEQAAPGLGLDLPETGSDASGPYRVLARKYRPQNFDELIGQDAMVRTLANAIKRDRLAHAFLMTGVRGVGKTSTARLIAKALNCIGPDGEGGPTISPCGQCEPCQAIAEGRHIDVIEMDAASHTGVDDVREIIEAVRYAAVSARYKIYIIDEVHMLSKSAFNALLKTLEEPPAHVKFLFATTEVNKLPVTVLSRCQRFDLRRISAAQLAEHFGKICDLEGVQAEDAALAMIADAAQGSVRDGLSILDQAIAHADMAGDQAAGETEDGAADQGLTVRTAQVRDMLGLADRSAMRDLLEHILAGKPPEMLEALSGQYALGVAPQALLGELLNLIHAITLYQASPKPSGEGVSGDNEDSAAIARWAEALGAAQLHRLWQLLLKGHEEVSTAPLPWEACEMALLRVIHAQNLPDPGTLARLLANGAGQGATSGVQTGAEAPASEPAAQAHRQQEESSGHNGDIATLEALASALEQAGHMLLAGQVTQYIRPVSISHGRLHYSPCPQCDRFVGDLAVALQTLTGVKWDIRAMQGQAEPSLSERNRQAEETAKAGRLNHPMVRAALEAFPDAQILGEENEPVQKRRMDDSNWSARV